MKIWGSVALLMVGGFSFLHADDNLLRNGDFAHGIAHWEGDCHSLDSSTGGLDASSTQSTPGASVKLRHRDWTRILQTYPAKAGSYTLTVNYTVSSGLTFSQNADDYTGLSGKVQYWLTPNVGCKPGQWMLLTGSGTRSSQCAYKTPNLGPGAQTVTSNFDAEYEGDQIVCIAFPPGDGTITLNNIAVVPN